ncbi:MerR family transcriptional regulator [Antarcticimicrobium luteum]|uniref:MerR family transcriptional regulator n=1 Tax=Antarcticimicrobium luteum TaxID=2547397 RepID=UPI001FE201C6|nr:MerR family transcriptional regulator [Antarcticimicrobium luteum]
MTKSPDAFRTISEVAAWLGVQAHVLRFWESKFTQVKPVKRAGGRRYYRPADMRLIGGIKTLLHDEGMTIKGVQKMLREQGAAHVAALSPLLDGDDSGDAPAPGGTVLAFKAKSPPEKKARSTPVPVPDPSAAPAPTPGAPAPTKAPSGTPAASGLPSFLNKPEQPVAPTARAPATPPIAPAAAAPSDPSDAPEPEPPYTPGPLGHLAGVTTLSLSQANEIAPLTRALRAWFDRVEKAGQA